MPEFQTIQTNDLSYISYLVPSILGMSLMQVGIFAAIPLVADREKLILKRLGATPLRRWQLVGSNVLMRLLIALVQTMIIVGVGTLFFGVEIDRPLARRSAFFVILGSLTFIALGYVIASFARPRRRRTAMTQAVQFPMMFLSGTFFPIAAMARCAAGRRPGPAADVPRRRAAPGDGRRDAVRAARRRASLVLARWLVGLLRVAARFFKWQ